MKTIFFLIAGSILSFLVIAQDITTEPLWQKYCAKLKDGKMIVMTDGMELTSDVTLNNGTTIKTDGTVIKSDGTKIILEDGDCVDKDGKMVEPYVDKKIKKDKLK